MRHFHGCNNHNEMSYIKAQLKADEVRHLRGCNSKP